jgi:hypothetical protein
MNYVIIALALVGLAAVLAFVFNNLDIWEKLTGYSSSFIGLFVFGLVGAVVGQLVGWGFDFGPRPLDIYVIPVIVLCLAGIFAPAVILQS